MRISLFLATIVATLLRFAALLPLVVFAQQAYPNKPIKMIVPLAAASAVDNAARIVATKMSASLGQQIVIENGPGAAGQIGTQQVAKAAPDGYTIGGFNDSIMTMLPNMGTALPWDILRDFAPVSLVATIEWGLVANNESSLRTAGDLIAAAKARPGEINYGSGANRCPEPTREEPLAPPARLTLTPLPH